MGKAAISLLTMSKDTFLVRCNRDGFSCKKNDGQCVLGKEGKGYIYFSETGEVQLYFQNVLGEYSGSWTGPLMEEVEAARGKVIPKPFQFFKGTVESPRYSLVKKALAS